MSWRALPGWGARPGLEGPEGGRGFPLFLAILVPGSAAAPFMGEEDYFRWLLDCLYLAGALFLLRHSIRWPRWLWALRRRFAVEREKVWSLARWMLLELLFACFWFLGAKHLRSPELISVYLGPLPLPLCFFAALALAGLSVGGTSGRASALGLLSTTDAIKQSKFGQVVPEAAGALSELPLYREIARRFKAPLRTTGTGIAFLAVVSGIALNGGIGYCSIHGSGAFRQHILGQSEVPEQRGTGGSDHGNSGSGQGGECEGAEPGEPAPAARAQELRALWLGSEEIKGLGYEEAGCPLPATPEPGHPEVWLQQGRCEGVLEGLGVSSPFGDPAMLLQQAAREGARLGDEGVLLSASPRRRIGEGDLHLLQSTRGSYALVRSKRSAGEIEEESRSEVCGHFDDRNVPYTLVPPGLVGIWRQILDSGWAWPEGGSPGGRAVGDFTFVSAATGEPVAQAHCLSELTCKGSFEGEVLPPIAISEISLEELLVLAGS